MNGREPRAAGGWAIRFLAVGLMSLAAGSSQTLISASGPPDDGGAEQARILEELLKAHNQVRTDSRLPPLKIDARLVAAALVHSRDMARSKQIAHEGSDGSTPADRIKRAGFHYVLMGENVASGQDTVDEVMKGWMESPGHKQNILGDFSHMGGARVDGPDGNPYWSVDFGTPIPRLDPARAAGDVIELLDRSRKAEDLAPLRPDPRLGKVAMAMARSAAKASDLKAETTETENPLEALKKEGLELGSLRQSLGSGHPNAADFVASLLKENEQKLRILGPASLVGVGYARASDDAPFWCILLGEP